MNDSINEDLEDRNTPNREKNKALGLMGLFFIIMIGAGWYFLDSMKKNTLPVDVNVTEPIKLINPLDISKDRNGSQYYTKEEILSLNEEVIETILQAIKENCCDIGNSKKVKEKIVLRKGDVVFNKRTGGAIVDNGVILYQKENDVVYDDGVVVIRDGKKVTINRAIVKKDGTIVPLEPMEQKKPVVESPVVESPKTQKSYTKPSHKSQKSQKPQKPKEIQDIKDKMAKMKKDHANKMAKMEKDHAIAMEYSLPGRINDNGNLEIDTSKIDVDFKDVIAKKVK